MKLAKKYGQCMIGNQKKMQSVHDRKLTKIYGLCIEIINIYRQTMQLMVKMSSACNKLNDTRHIIGDIVSFQ